MIKIKDLYVWHETRYLRRNLKLREGDNPKKQTTSKSRSGLGYLSFHSDMWYTFRQSLPLCRYLSFHMRYIYKKSCPINVDNWDYFLIK